MSIVAFLRCAAAIGSQRSPSAQCSISRQITMLSSESESRKKSRYPTIPACATLISTFTSTSAAFAARMCLHGIRFITHSFCESLCRTRCALAKVPAPSFDTRVYAPSALEDAMQRNTGAKTGVLRRKCRKLSATCYDSVRVCA